MEIQARIYLARTDSGVFSLSVCHTNNLSESFSIN